ncbi:DNA polymerase III subunit alpha [Thermosulfuriphilus sp.]
MAGFVHLHLHTEFSLLDGAIRLPALFSLAKEYGYQAIAKTDHGNLFGTVAFYEAARAAGIKPIIGSEVYVAPGSRKERRAKGAHEAGFHLVLLCMNETGYKNLIRLITLANFEGFYWKPRVDKELLKQYHEGLIALSACLHGEIAHACLHQDPSKACKIAEEYARIFPDRFYIEIQENDIPEQKVANQGLIEIAQRLGLPVVATNDCHYLRAEDARVHDVLLCIQTNKTVQDENRLRFSTDKLYFTSPEEMATRFAYLPEAVSITEEIASRCHLELKLGEHHFPKFPLKEGKTYEEMLDEEARKGLKARLKELSQGMGLADEEAGYWRRLELELSVIKEMGFASYFLIVADFISWAKKKGIPVGPGRGSAAGSLVAYAMGITNIDPIRYGLLFERFLNLERKSLPDIDVDFCMQRRGEVLQYVYQKYGGAEYVAQIATFGQMKARAVVRDVGRALGMSYPEVDRIAKLIPEELGITLDKAIALEPRLKEAAEKDPQVAELLSIARVLEGLPRHSSTHAAGVVISDAPLTEYVPLMKGDRDEIITQYDMKAIEKIGLIKFDFLGLKTLTIIDTACRLIEKHQGLKVDPHHIPLDDDKTFELLCQAETAGVFQLESSGMRNLLTRMKPSQFTDLIALVALYRPGPLESGMVDQFIKAKHGLEPVRYIVPELEEILKETYGVIVYQEQVMKIASKLAGYSLGEADILRRAMGKKVPEIMAAQRERFISGATERGIPKDKAEVIFDLMEKFAGYGFNKSHSAAYALIAYQTAYLKAHFPVPYMTALLSYEMGNADQVVKYVNECRRMGIEVLPPDINESDRDFTIVGNKIRFGLAAIKNVGEGAIDSILQARQEGAFSSFEDFCLRVDLRKVNRRVIESLIKAGAFDSLSHRRAQLMDVLDKAIELAQRRQRAKELGQISLFDIAGAKNNRAEGLNLPDVPEWSDTELLAHEKEALGFYISGHPIDPYEQWLSRISGVNSQMVSEMRDGARVCLGGIIRSVKEITTRRGDKMGFVLLEDRHGLIEIVCFSEIYRQMRPLIEAEAPIFVQGTVNRDERGAKVIADQVFHLEEAQKVALGSVTIRIEAGRITPEDFSELKEILLAHPGRCPVSLNIIYPEEGEVEIELPEEFSVEPGPDFNRSIEALFRYQALEFGLAAPKGPEANGRQRSLRP